MNLVNFLYISGGIGCFTECFASKLSFAVISNVLTTSGAVTFSAAFVASVSSFLLLDCNTIIAEDSRTGAVNRSELSLHF